MIKAVIDTNVLISAIGFKSPYRIIFDKIKSGDVALVVSNDIINEYSEIISKTGQSFLMECQAWNQVLVYLVVEPLI